MRENSQRRETVRDRAKWRYMVTQREKKTKRQNQKLYYRHCHLYLISTLRTTSYGIGRQRLSSHRRIRRRSLANTRAEQEPVFFRKSKPAAVRQKACIDQVA